MRDRKMIAQAMQKVGNEASSPSMRTVRRNLIDSSRQNSTAAIISPYFITTPRKNDARTRGVYVSLAREEAVGLPSMLPVLEAVVQSGRRS